MLETLKQFFEIGMTNGEISKPTFKEYAKKIVKKAQELLKRLDARAKMVYMGISLFLLFAVPYLVGFFTMVSLSMKGRYTFAFAVKQPVFRYLLIGVFPGVGLLTTLLIYFIAGGIMLITIIIRSPDLAQISKTDYRGVNFATNKTYGSAEWMDREEAEKAYCVGDISEATGYILGQFSEDGKECISLPTDSSGNQNYLVIGSPGRGKTYSFGFNACLQALVRNESIVIVDPKGELCEKLYNLYIQHGYSAKVYNLVNPRRSNAWNFVSEIFDVNTGQMDFGRLTAFVDIAMTNTMDGEKEDGFWGPGERNMFQAAVAYVGWQHENTYRMNLGRSADKWELTPTPLLNDAEKTRLFHIIRSKETTIREKEEALKSIMRGSDIVSEQEIYRYFSEMKDASDPANIDQVFSLLAGKDVTGIEALFKAANIPPSHPAAIAWNIFQHSAASTQPNLIQGLTQRLNLFTNTDIVSMSVHDDINFRELGEHKTVIFCVISDKDSSRKLLTSLFFSFLFRDVADAADELGPKSRIPVNVMCDEFANIGRIPDFERFIATVRSRKIYLSIIIQSVAQLAKVYDENDQETLCECCDTVLFLGCNGARTAQFISELSGIASIITNSVKDSKNISGMRGFMDGYATSEGAGKRELVTPDECRRLPVDEVLIYHAGRQMLRAKRCGYNNHPLFKAGLPPEMPLYDYPETAKRYGVHISAFEEKSTVDLKSQETWNAVNARAMIDDREPKRFDDVPKPAEPVQEDTTSAPVASYEEQLQKKGPERDAPKKAAPPMKREKHTVEYAGYTGKYESRGAANPYGSATTKGKKKNTNKQPKPLAGIRSNF